MFSKVIRFTGIAKQVFRPTNPLGLTHLYTPRLTSLNVFLFSEEKKTSITPKKPIDRPPADDDSIQGKMKPLEDTLDELKDKKEQEDRGMEISSFGTNMLIISALALILAYIYMEIQVIRANKKKKPESKAAVKVKGVGKAQIGGPWELIGTDGKPFSNKDLQGKYYLIYFGFTHCPDICPNSLAKLAKAVNKVKKSKEANFFDLKTVFVSVDPDRDSAEKMTKFVSHFDPEMISVTGKHNMDPALRDCMKQFKIYATKLQFQDEDSQVKGRKSYTIDHTILTYLMSDTNEYLAHLGGNMGEHDLANIILEKITEDKREKMKGKGI